MSLCRATRPTEPTAPDFVRKYVSWGAGPRASQYLVLAAKARAILERPLRGGRRGRARARRAGAGPPRAAELSRRGRRAERPRPGGPPHRDDQAGLAAWRRKVASPLALDPADIARLESMSVRARVIVEGAFAGLHANPHAGIVDRVRRAQGIRARRRHPPHRLEGGGAGRPLLHQAVRGRDRDAHVSSRRRLRLDGLRAQAAEQAGLRQLPRGRARLTCWRSRAIRPG